TPGGRKRGEADGAGGAPADVVGVVLGVQRQADGDCHEKDSRPSTAEDGRQGREWPEDKLSEPIPRGNEIAPVAKSVQGRGRGHADWRTKRRHGGRVGNHEWRPGRDHARERAAGSREPLLVEN